MIFRYPFIVFVFIFTSNLFAQTADFSIPSLVCLNEIVPVVNNSSAASSYLWDFCQDGLEQPSTAQFIFDLSTALPSIVNPEGIEVVNDNGSWYLFALGRNNNTLYRMDFGSDLSNPFPIVNSLGNLDGAFNLPTQIEILKDGASWFGFVTNFGNSKIIRLNFGGSVANNIPFLTTTVLGSFGSGTGPRGLDIMKYETGYAAIVSYWNNVITLLNFSNGLASAPSANYTISNSASQLNRPIGVSLQMENNNWYAIVANYISGKILHLNFGSNLFSDPLFTTLSVVPGATDVALLKDGLLNFGFIEGQNGLTRIDFKNGLQIDGNESITSPNNYGGVLTGLFGLSFVKEGSNWRAFTLSQTSNRVHKIIFTDICSNSPVSLKSSTQPTPNNLKYSQSGSYQIELIAYAVSGVSSTSTQFITVTDTPSPIIDFENVNVCTQSSIQYLTQSNQTLLSTSWSFGDTETSTLANPTHQYSSAGEYTVQLSVQAENGCNNFTEKTIKIYDPPAAAFTLPPGPICTNNEFTFTNNTPDNFDGNLSFEWLVNDVQESTARDFVYTFSTEGDQQVKLRTSIPGCSSEMTQPILNMQTGPIVDFDYTGKCEDEEILFTNQSSGVITAFDWDFENSNTSTEENPSVLFPDYGIYNVSLSAIATNGCVSKIKKPVTIYSVPQTNFALELPPFSCANSPAQFNDATPPMPDSNITSWQWSFGDPSNSSSSQRNPSFTYALAGNYDVSLTTTSNYGCSNSIQKTVTIYPSPQADFSFGTACVNQDTPFTDLSTGDIKSWLWSMQGNTYSEQNPKHKFLSAATYTALLTVTGTNNCISQAIKNVTVPVPIVADFSSTITCATKPSLFDEINKGGVDPAVSWIWNFDTQGSATGSPAQHVFSSIGNYSVTMNTTRQSGCTYSVTKTIPIVEPPKAQFTTSREAGGVPLKVDFTNTSLNATSYYWKFGDAANTTSTQFSPSFTYTGLGEYNAELRAINNSLNCEDSYSQLITVVTPLINVALSDFRLTEMAGGDNLSPVVTIENKSNVDLINPQVYLDLSGNDLISEKTETVIRPNESYDYTFVQSVAPRTLRFLCAEVKVNGDEYAFDNRQCVSLLDEYVSKVPYPNPARDELMLEWINVVDEPMNLVIYNGAGQAIINRQYAPTLKGLNQVKLDVSGLSAGIYFVSYAVSGQTQNFKFSIVR